MVHPIFGPSPMPIFIPPDLGTDAVLQQAHFSGLLSKHCNIGSISFGFFLFSVSLLPYTLSLSSLSIKKGKKMFCLFLGTKVGQGHLCPRNMLRLIQFTRAHRNRNYLWTTEMKLTQVLSRNWAEEWPNVRPQMWLPGSRCNLSPECPLGKQEEVEKSVLGIGAVEILSLPLSPMS